MTEPHPADGRPAEDAGPGRARVRPGAAARGPARRRPHGLAAAPPGHRTGCAGRPPRTRTRGPAADRDQAASGRPSGTCRPPGTCRTTRPRPPAGAGWRAVRRTHPNPDARPAGRPDAAATRRRAPAALVARCWRYCCWPWPAWTAGCSPTSRERDPGPSATRPCRPPRPRCRDPVLRLPALRRRRQHGQEPADRPGGGRLRPGEQDHQAGGGQGRTRWCRPRPTAPASRRCPPDGKQVTVVVFGEQKVTNTSLQPAPDRPVPGPGHPGPGARPVAGVQVRPDLATRFRRPAPGRGARPGSATGAGTRGCPGVLDGRQRAGHPVRALQERPAGALTS